MAKVVAVLKDGKEVGRTVRRRGGERAADVHVKDGEGFGSTRVRIAVRLRRMFANQGMQWERERGPSKEIPVAYGLVRTSRVASIPT